MSSSSIGRDAEWELREYLEGIGFLVIRSAASRIVDLIAIRMDPPHDELFIEVKSTMNPAFKISRVRSNRKQIDDLKLYASLIEAIPILAVKFRSKDQWAIQVVNSDLPKVIKAVDAKKLSMWTFDTPEWRLINAGVVPL